MKCEVCGVKKPGSGIMETLWNRSGYLWQCPTCTSRSEAFSDSASSLHDGPRPQSTGTPAKPGHGEELSPDLFVRGHDGQRSRTETHSSGGSSPMPSTKKSRPQSRRASEESLHDLRAAEGELATALYRVRRLLRLAKLGWLDASRSGQEEDKV